MNEKQPLVSIVIPFYNAKSTILNAIKSVIYQSYLNWELILLDDGSTDDTVEQLKLINHKNIRLVSDGKNLGLAFRLNQMTKLSNGTYIARMDADDIMHPDRITKQVNYLINNPSVDVVCTSAISINNNYELLGIRDLDKLNMEPFEVFKKGSIIHPTVMASKEWFFNHKYNENFLRAQDRELWVRSLNDTKFSKIQEPLLYYTESSNYSSEKLLNSYRIERFIINLHGIKSLKSIEYLYLLTRSYVKSFIVYFLNKIGKLDILINERSKKFISYDQFNEYNNVLNQILKTEIPK